MSKKEQGSNAERELVHLLWFHGWSAVRVAGSGSMRYPSPDIIARKEATLVAIECKHTKQDKKYVDVREITELVTFAKGFKAVPLLGVRFTKREWLFFHPRFLSSTGKFVVVSRDDKGMSIDALGNNKLL